MSTATRYQTLQRYSFVVTCVLVLGIIFILWSAPECRFYPSTRIRMEHGQEVQAHIGVSGSIQDIIESLAEDDDIGDDHGRRLVTNVDTAYIKQNSDDEVQTVVGDSWEEADVYVEVTDDEDEERKIEDDLKTEDQEMTNEEKGRCVKRIHIFSDMDLLKHIPELKHYTGLFKVSPKPDFESDVECWSRGYDCDLKLTLGANVSMIKGKDAVVFGMVGIQFRRNTLLDQVLDLEPEPDQVWIYFSTESPHRIVRWTETLDFARLKYHLLMTYDSRSEIHIPFGYYKPFNTSEETPMDLDLQDGSFYNRTGLISWVASNCKGVFWPRNSLISYLLKIMPLDDYGACGHKECLPKRSEYCNKIMASYVFYLATPNSECQDYITEKFWLNSLTSGVVPVVFGARKENYLRVAPPNSFVHAADFESLQDLADYLQQVANDKDRYRKYYEWRKRGEVVLTFPTLPWVFCRAVPYLHPGQPREVKLIGDSPWYTGCRELPDRHSMNVVYRELTDWTIWR